MIVEHEEKEMKNEDLTPEKLPSKVKRFYSSAKNGLVTYHKTVLGFTTEYPSLVTWWVHVTMVLLVCVLGVSLITGGAA